jgi:transposase
MSNNNGLFLCEPSAENHPPDESPASTALNAKQLQVAVALAAGKTETDAARLVGVNRSTIYRWQRDPEFVAELNRLKREIRADRRAKLRTLLDTATEIMQRSLEDEDEDIRLKAAMFVLTKFAPRAHEPIGPSTAKGVEKLWKDEAARLCAPDEVRSVRTMLP